ncbi:MAG TPA: HEAT repeat domain-containing protein [Acidimicrobiia bacterium]|nr:HEAT repeat domain-containing protein [Acidimicrobiia bacterium]
MVDLLIITAITITGVNAAIGLWVVVHRILSNRRLRRLAAARDRLKPAVLGWIDGDDSPATAATGIEYEAIADLLASYGKAVRGGARQRVADLAREVGMTDRLIDQLRSRRGWRRAMAAYRLGDLGTREEAARALIRRLKDRDRRVKDAAARSLGSLAAVEAVEILVRRLASNDLSRPVGAQALRTLGTAAAPALSSLLVAEEEEVRAMAAELLGLIGSSGGSNQLAAVLTDPSPEVRVRATRALGRIGDASAAEALHRTLDDPIPFVRAAAATAVAKIGHSASFERLVEMARSDVFVPAHAAAYAAAYLQPEAVEKLATDPRAGIHLQEAADLLGIVG